MVEITNDIQGEDPWCMLFTVDIILIGEILEEMNNRLEEWKETLKAKV